ncbi:MAG: hypothetical protein RL026_98 [Pseudomonadota bacterium]|jgi:hypothetical protein
MLARLAIAGLLLATSTWAIAQAPPSPPSPQVMAAREAVGKACAADMKTHCGDKTGHEGMMCLRAQQGKASAPCTKAMDELVKLMTAQHADQAGHGNHGGQHKH